MFRLVLHPRLPHCWRHPWNFTLTSPRASGGGKGNVAWIWFGGRGGRGDRVFSRTYSAVDKPTHPARDCGLDPDFVQVSPTQRVRCGDSKGGVQKSPALFVRPGSVRRTVLSVMNSVSDVFFIFPWSKVRRQGHGATTAARERLVRARVGAMG